MSVLERTVIDRLIGGVNPRVLAELIDQPEAETSIERNRRLRVLYAILAEGNSALATLGLLTIHSNPELYAGYIGADIGLSIAQQQNKWEFHNDVMIGLRQKLSSIIDYIPLINLELKKRGYAYDGAYIWRPYFEIEAVEQSSVLLNTLLTLSRPIIQTLTMSRELPAPMIAIALALTYALVPVFSALGKMNHRLSSKYGTVVQAKDEMRFVAPKSTLSTLEAARKTFYNKFRKSSLIQTGVDKIEKIGFLLAAISTKSEAVGMLNYILEIYSVPRSFNTIRQSKEGVKRSLSYIKALYDIMSGRPYFLTDASWDRYRTERLHDLGLPDAQQHPGITLKNFQTKIPAIDGKDNSFTDSLTCTLKPGQVVLVNGGSGEGKSILTQLGLCGLSKSLGSFQITDNDGQAVWLESLTREEIRDRVWYVQPSDGCSGIRVCDFYSDSVIAAYCESLSKTEDSLSSEELLMLSLPDALLEREIKLLETQTETTSEQVTTHTEGHVPIFSAPMLPQIISFRELRKRHVESIIQRLSTNLRDMRAIQEIGTLSSGMSDRFMGETTFYRMSQAEREHGTHTRVLILDEPFGHLDSQGAQEYMDRILEIINSPNPPVVLMISHNNQPMIRSSLRERLIEVEFSGTADTASSAS